MCFLRFMEKQAQLFTRGQIQQLAGIPSADLNYLAREGAIVPTEGGTGKGQHRRFSEVEVMISAILYELKANGGVNIGRLREIGADLRAAAAYFRALDCSFEAIFEALSCRLNGDDRPSTDSEVSKALKAIQHKDPHEVQELVGTASHLLTPGGIGEPAFLIKTPEGRWSFQSNTRLATVGSCTFLAVDTGQLHQRIWGLAEPRK